MIAEILLYGGIFIVGLVAGLKVIAPLTKTKIDDEVLEYAEDAEKLLRGLGVEIPDDVTVHAAAATKTPA